MLCANNTSLFQGRCFLNKSRYFIGLEGLFPLFYGLADFLIVGFAALVAHGMRFDNFEVSSLYTGLVMIAGLAVILLSTYTRSYESWRGRSKWLLLTRICAAWSFAFVALILFLVVTKQAHEVSRLWIGTWAILGLTSAIAFRGILYAIMSELRQRGINHKKILVVGATDTAAQVVENLRQSPWVGLDVAAVLQVGAESHHNIDKDLIHSNVALKDLPQLAIDLNAVEVWVCLPLSQANAIEESFHHLRNTIVNIRYVPDWTGFQLLNHRVSHVASMYTLDLVISPLTPVSYLVKSLEDKLLASLILTLISPLLLFIAIGVKLSSSGPVFYRQERISWNGKKFTMLKFRSMPTDTESDTGPVWATAGESRATRFGSFLRRTSLDELPQFINVIRGEMSIVGPRPERTHFVEKFKDEIPGYMQKHQVKAGVTGWAQVNGWRGDTCIKTRIEHDLHYIENWSLLLDLKIILMTLVKGLVHRNAY